MMLPSPNVTGRKVYLLRHQITMPADLKKSFQHTENSATSVASGSRVVVGCPADRRR